MKSIEEEQKPETNNEESNKKRDELLKLAEDGEIERSVSYIQKASQKVINKIYSEYERKRLENANEFFTHLLISKFSSTLGGLDAIDSPEILASELKTNF